MREAVRSGRRANFFITENRFIDCYAKKVGGSGVAVYSILQRCANSETRETWIGADKMAEVLDMDRSTVYRYLKQLEDLRLIKTLRTREKTIYVVLPVPPPPAEAGSTPLFDTIEFKTTNSNSTWSPVASTQMSFTSAIDSHECDSSVASTQQAVSLVRPISRTGENRNKEEQDLENKTQKQDLLNETVEQDNPEINNSAKRIIKILGLPDTAISAATAAVELKVTGTKLSMDGIVQDIVTTANHAERRGIHKLEFLEDFLAQASARTIVENLDLPATNNLISTVTAAVKAEVTYTGFSVEKVAGLIRSAALEDRRRGITIDRFYFENVKWRNGNAGYKPSASQQRSERTKQNILDGIAAEIGRRNKSDRPEQ